MTTDVINTGYYGLEPCHCPICVEARLIAREKDGVIELPLDEAIAIAKQLSHDES